MEKWSMYTYTCGEMNYFQIWLKLKKAKLSSPSLPCSQLREMLKPSPENTHLPLEIVLLLEGGLSFFWLDCSWLPHFLSRIKFPGEIPIPRSLIKIGLIEEDKTCCEGMRIAKGGGRHSVEAITFKSWEWPACVLWKRRSCICHLFILVILTGQNLI